MSKSLIEFRDDRGVFVAKVTAADLDNVTGAQLNNELMALVPSVGSGCLVLDFSAVRFIQTQGIGAALQLNNTVEAAGGHVCLCVPDDTVRRMFAMTKLDSVLKIHESLAVAMQAMRGA